MNMRIMPSATGGEIRAIASKSTAHRTLILAAFSKNESRIFCQELNEDIEATIRCLTALGAEIKREGYYICVRPIKALSVGALLDCGESGSTMRFLVPVSVLLGADSLFLMSGRLPSRPLSPLREELQRCGVEFSAIGSNPLITKGRVAETEFSIRGDVSSQFISGLLLGLAVSGRSGRINILGELQSAPYVEMTADVIRHFGAEVVYKDGAYFLNARGGLCAPDEIAVEGDWSNAAFPLALGAIGRNAVTVTGLDVSSRQGDKRIVEILRSMGARVECGEDGITVYPSRLHGTEVDAGQIPDLVPVVAVLCAVAEGESLIYNAERLRIKESDRLFSTSQTLTALGAQIEERVDGLSIVGVDTLSGGTVSSFGDHRIAMSAAVASVRCEAQVVIEGAEAVAKSYPTFFEDMAALGMMSEAAKAE